MQNNLPDPPQIPDPEIEEAAPEPPMIDIHDAHHAASSWKEFFIHIATIVLGLLIAVGLEQGVEYIHHRNQASEARALLRTERDQNRASLEIDFYATIHNQHDLLDDLAVLDRLKTHSLLPTDKLLFARPAYGFFQGEWKAVQQSGVIAYLSPADLTGVAYLYEREENFVSREARSAGDLDYATAMLQREGPWVRRPQTISSPVNALLDKTHNDGRGALDQAAMEREYSESYIDQSRFLNLTPSNIADLEHAINLALVDDKALLNDCYAIERWIAPANPQQAGQ
jgi:hypothetical protein